MRPLCISTTRIPAHLLRIALKHRGLAADLLTIHETLPDRSAHDGDRPSPIDQEIVSPAAILLQQGGMEALGRMGLDTHDIAAQGFSVTSCLVLGETGKALVEFNASVVSTTTTPLWIATRVFREYLSRRTVDIRTPEQPPYDISRDDGQGRPWKRVACPGILLRTLTGELLRKETQILWDHRRVHVGIAHFSDERLVCYAIPKQIGPKPIEEEQCLEALAQAPQRLNVFFRRGGEPLEDQWFPLALLGYRPCWDGTVLHWGPTTLRLHPLTGQWISYWAIQANRLADELARSGTISEEFIQRLERNNQVMFWRHMRTMNYYLRPNLFWKTFYRPSVWALRHSSVLRQRTMRRAALII